MTVESTATDTQSSTEQTPTGDTSTEGTTDASSGTSGAAAADDASTLLGASDAGTGTAEGASEPAAAGTVADTPPETYDLKLTATNEAGEETETPLDPVLVEAATPLLKDAGLTNDQANKLLPLVPQVQAQVLKAQSDEFAKVRGDWAKEVEADPEIGGKNLPETLRLSAKALDHFTGPADDKNEFRKLLNESGLGNHPVMLRAFRNIGSALSEDSTFVRNTTEQTTTKSREEKNYPDDQPKS